MPDPIQQTAKDNSLSTDTPLRFEPSPRRVRIMFKGQTIADSQRMRLLHGPGHIPVYYFPQADVRMEFLTKTQHHTPSPLLGDASHWTVRVGEAYATNAAWAYLQPSTSGVNLANYMAFDWDAMDAWFEEDEEVYVHARDPYKRVDALRSSRHIRVLVAGEIVADSHSPVLLFETGLPTRYYLPKIDVRKDLLLPSETITRCPYKGVASYYSVKVGTTLVPDIAWYYPFPIPECPRIENLVCFYNERVDALYVDGELQEKPQTKWS